MSTMLQDAPAVKPGSSADAPTAEDRQWAAENLNSDWPATEPSPFEASLWDATTPDDVLDAESCYAELARRAAMAEEQARIEAGAYPC